MAPFTSSGSRFLRIVQDVYKRQVMRKGFFWYYLEKSDLKPKVKEEVDPPCLNLYIRDRKTLLFQVVYYKNRINFEVFHALTDGTGAIQFLKELVKNYLILRYRAVSYTHLEK